MKKQEMKKQKDTVKKRRKSFFVMLAAVLMVFNLIPMSAFAGTQHNISVIKSVTNYNNNYIFELGDSIKNDTDNTIHLIIDSNNLAELNNNEVYPISTELGGSDKWYYKHYSGDVTLKPIPCIVVSFDANGHGTAPDAQRIYTYGVVEPFTHNDLIEPTAPTATGYTFGGWYKEAACTNAWTFGTDTATQDTTLYAKWTPNNYTVTFDPNNGADATTQTVAYGNKATRPDDPTKSGCVFSGWYLSNSDTSAGAFDFDTAITSDITLVAGYLSDGENKLEISEGFSDFTEDMINEGFDTEEKVRNAMYTAVVEEIDDDDDVNEAELIVGSQLYDVEFKVSFDGGNTWQAVSEETFPEDGLTVDMPYPEGTDAKTNNFIVAHMFTHNMLGHKAGETETMIPEKTENGIRFKVSSLSPVLVTWSLAAQGVSIEPEYITFSYQGEIYQLTATVTPVGAVDKSLTWTSSDESVATVDGSGLVTAVGEGSCTITATTVDGGFSDVSYVSVSYPVVDNSSNNTPVVIEESRAPKTGENVASIFVMMLCLAAGAGLTGYAIYTRRKRS